MLISHYEERPLPLVSLRRALAFLLGGGPASLAAAMLLVAGSKALSWGLMLAAPSSFPKGLQTGSGPEEFCYKSVGAPDEPSLLIKERWGVGAGSGDDGDVRVNRFTWVCTDLLERSVACHCVFVCVGLSCLYVWT